MTPEDWGDEYVRRLVDETTRELNEFISKVNSRGPVPPLSSVTHTMRVLADGVAVYYPKTHPAWG